MTDDLEMGPMTRARAQRDAESRAFTGGMREVTNGIGDRGKKVGTKDRLAAARVIEEEREAFAALVAAQRERDALSAMLTKVEAENTMLRDAAWKARASEDDALGDVRALRATNAAQLQRLVTAELQNTFLKESAARRAAEGASIRVLGTVAKPVER